MKLYKVKSLAVSGLRNKVHKCREIVKESNFAPGRAEELVKSGHLVPYVEEEVKSTGTNAGSGATNDPVVLTKKQIIAKLEEKGIEFDINAKKTDLQALLDDSEKDETGTNAGSGALGALKDNLD